VVRRSAMGKCEFCGEEAGVLRKRHRECQDKHEEGTKRIVAIAQDAITSRRDLTPVEESLLAISRACFVGPTSLRELLVQAWEKAVSEALEDNILSRDEEHALVTFAKRFSLEHKDLDGHGALTRLAKSEVLRSIVEGNVRSRADIVGFIPFNLQKGEKLIWVFQNVKYYAQKTKRTYVGASQGLSIRVMKGVYYRVGSFKGRPVDVQETVHVDTGAFGVTDRHIYFAGRTKAFRIRHDNVVSLTPYSDGIGIQRDAPTATLQSFVTGDGWFTYNLLANLSRCSAD
jgi:hypothetical protein